MAICRILCICFSCICLLMISGASDGSGILTPAYAGGEGGNNAHKEKPENQSKPKKKSKADKAAEAEIAKARKQIQKMIEDIHKAAKKTDLKQIATDLNEIRILQQTLDHSSDALDGTKYRNEPNDLLQALRGYARQKKNKTLSFYAQNIIRAMRAHRVMWEAQNIGHELQKAEANSDPVKTPLLQDEYKEARKEFHRLARKIPEPLRSRIFQPLPAEPLGKQPANFD